MATIATNVSALPIPAKLEKGQDIITKGTNNPNVPGNTAVLAAFTNAQEDLNAANNAHVAAQSALKNLMAVRDNALATWIVALSNLAAFTQSVTQGEIAKILSAGFDVRSTPSPKPPLGAPVNVLAETNGSPGVTKLSWDPLQGAVSYLVQQSPSPMTEESWTQVDTPTKASSATNGVEPGKEYWYRVAGVDSRGQGPWSAPACRQVM